MSDGTAVRTRRVLGALMLSGALTAAPDTTAGEPPAPAPAARAVAPPSCPWPLCVTADILDDPVNVIHHASIGGRPGGVHSRPLPPTAFGRDTSRSNPKPDDVVPAPLPRLHPRLADLVRSDPSAPIAVIIQLRDDLLLPRLPDLPPGVERDSRRGQAILAEGERLAADVLAQRAQRTARFVTAAQALGVALRADEQYWIVNAFRATVEARVTPILSQSPEVTYIQPDTDEPLDLPLKPLTYVVPFDGNPLNDVADGRARIRSDFFFDQGLYEGTIALLDTGVAWTHVLFNSPSLLGLLKDCVHSDEVCADHSDPAWDPGDTHGHGTSSAAIIMGNGRLGNAYRGVTGIKLDSWKVYLGNNLDVGAVLRAYQRALLTGSRVLVAEMQAIEHDHGVIAQAADNAFVLGAITVAANGNFGPDPGSVRSPARAHKALGVGAYLILSGVPYGGQGRGPALDGRIKPDLQAPTDTETADRDAETAMGEFSATSGATPYAAGAAALVRNWLRARGTFDIGHTYARMILSGPESWPDFDNRVGTGHFRLPICGVAHWGKVELDEDDQVAIPIFVPAGGLIQAALWWPEWVDQEHSDVDLYLFSNSGPFLDGLANGASESGPSVFERARAGGASTARFWHLVIKRRAPFLSDGVPFQRVYWAADVNGC